MDVAKLVAQTLKHLFPTIPVKRERQDDGSLQLPSFFVQQLETQATQKLNDEQIRQYNFDVVYLIDQHQMPATNNAEMADKLLAELDYLVDLNGSKAVKIQNLVVGMQGDDLHATFSVFYRMQQSIDSGKFRKEDMTHREEVKNG